MQAKVTNIKNKNSATYQLRWEPPIAEMIK